MIGHGVKKFTFLRNNHLLIWLRYCTDRTVTVLWTRWIILLTYI